jgi:hypothetical protein
MRTPRQIVILPNPVGSEIYPEPEMADESSGISYGFLAAEQAAARWPHKEHFAHFFPVEDIDE